MRGVGKRKRKILIKSVWRSETKPNEILKAQFRKENYLRKITYARGINQKFILRNLLEIKFSFGILAIIKMLEGKSFLCVFWSS